MRGRAAEPRPVYRVGIPTDSKERLMTVKGRKSGELEGEGSYTAARNFDNKQKKFVQTHKADIPKMGKDAEAALDGPEGEKLRKAEKAGAAKARH
jgi:sRNA-binding protein